MKRPFVTLFPSTKHILLSRSRYLHQQCFHTHWNLNVEYTSYTIRSWCYNPCRSTNCRIGLQPTKYIGHKFCECMYSQTNSKGISPASIRPNNFHIRTRILNNLTSTILPKSWFPDNERRMNNPIKIISTYKRGSD